jgi:hypothetical protein
VTAQQVILTFGYFDSSLLAGVTNDLPAFGDPVPIPIFYAHSVLPNTALPLINCMCSVASMGLLGILMKNDNEGTLLTSCPLALLILCPPKFWRNQSCCNVLYQVITCIWLQALCFCRVLFLPLYAGIGAAGNFAGSQSAQDIVLCASRPTHAPRIQHASHPTHAAHPACEPPHTTPAHPACAAAHAC